MPRPVIPPHILADSYRFSTWLRDQAATVPAEGVDTFLREAAQLAQPPHRVPVLSMVSDDRVFLPRLEGRVLKIEIGQRGNSLNPESVVPLFAREATKSEIASLDLSIRRGEVSCHLQVAVGLEDCGTQEIHRARGYFEAFGNPPDTPSVPMESHSAMGM